MVITCPYRAVWRPIASPPCPAVAGLWRYGSHFRPGVWDRPPGDTACAASWIWIAVLIYGIVLKFMPDTHLKGTIHISYRGWLALLPGDRDPIRSHTEVSCQTIQIHISGQSPMQCPPPMTSYRLDAQHSQRDGFTRHPLPCIEYQRSAVEPRNGKGDTPPHSGFFL